MRSTEGLAGLFISCLLIALAAVPVQAVPFTIKPVGSDADMLSLLQSISFVAEGRIGDRGGAATFEVDLGQSTAAPATTAQYAWPNAVAVPFTLGFDPNQNRVTFTVDGQSLTYSPSGTFTDIFFRTRSYPAGSGIVLDSLVFDGDSVGESVSAYGPNGLEILWLSGSTLMDGFQLSGTSTMSWSGSAPSQSQLAYQIKVGYVEPTGNPDVPEPCTLALAGMVLLGGAATAAFKRRAR
jgi:hypothetical protein